MIGLEQLTKISLATKAAVLLGLSLVVAAIYWFGFYSDLSSELSNLEQKHSELIKQQDDAHRRKATYDNDSQRRDELKKNHAQQLRALPSDSEMSSFLASLDIQAELVGLELKAVKPNKEEPQEYFARIPVKLELQGSYQQLAKFFYLVGNVDRIINIENIILRVASQDESGVQLTAEVMAITFRSVNIDTAKVEKTKKKKG